MLTLVITAMSASMTLVASHVPPRPTSTTATSTAMSANHRNAAPVTTSKYDGSIPISRSTNATTRNCSSSSSSEMGWSLRTMRSFTRWRCGLVYAPAEYPTVASNSVIMRVVVVLPLVPVRWIAGYSSCGEPRYSSSVPIRSRVGAPRSRVGAGTPTPVSRLTCASSQARGERLLGKLTRRRAARARPRRGARRRPRSRASRSFPPRAGRARHAGGLRAARRCRAPRRASPAS